MNEGICAGCGCECLDVIECSCGRQEVYACQDCLDSDINLVCGVCRDWAGRGDTLSSYPCRDFQEGEAAPGRVRGELLPAKALVGV